jgi:DNA-binding beta-propeller fold protein YncE
MRDRESARATIAAMAVTVIAAFPTAAQESFLCGSQCVPLRPLFGGEGVLASPGEVDAFSFTGVAGGTAQLKTTMPLNGGPLVRMRVFDPVGNEVSGGDACDTYREVETERGGTYALLVSACDGAATGEYFVGWRPMPLDLAPCGVTVTRQLMPGETDLFAVPGSGGSAVVDAIDVSSTIGLLRLENLDNTATCEGTFQAQSVGYLRVSDCVGQDEGTYALAVNEVADQPTNCGRLLTCGTAFDGELDVAGEVTAFTLERAVGTLIDVEAEERTGLAGGIRMRLFDPSGTELRDSCAASIRVRIASAGRHTLLISACDGLGTGDYSVRWTDVPACGAMEPTAGTPGGPIAYVLHNTDGSEDSAPTLGIVDTEANELRGLLPLGGILNPPKLHVGLNEAFVYVSVGEILGINTSSNKITKRLGFIGENESRIALHPNGSVLYSPSFIYEALAVVDVAAGRATNLIFQEGVNDLSSVDVSRDGLLYVAIGRSIVCFNGCPRQPRVEVIDTNSLSSVASVPDERFRQATDIFIHPDGRRAYVAIGNQSLLVIDANAQLVAGEIAVGALDVAFSPDGSRAYAAVDPGGIAVIDVAASTVLRTIHISAFDPFGSVGMGGVAVSADGKFLLATHGRATGGQRGLAVIDAMTEQVLSTHSTGEAYPVDVVTVAQLPDGLCVGDESGQTRVTVGELVTSVNYALDGCPTDPQIPPPGDEP